MDGVIRGQLAADLARRSPSPVGTPSPWSSRARSARAARAGSPPEALRDLLRVLLDAEPAVTPMRAGERPELRR